MQLSPTCNIRHSLPPTLCQPLSPFHSHLPASQPACRPACQPASLSACQPVCLPACLPAAPPFSAAALAPLPVPDEPRLAGCCPLLAPALGAHCRPSHLCSQLPTSHHLPGRCYSCYCCCRCFHCLLTVVGQHPCLALHSCPWPVCGCARAQGTRGR